MTTAAKSPFTVQAMNSNHPGSEFGVICFDEAIADLSLSECEALLQEDGWTHAQPMSTARPGVHKFLVSRQK